MKLDEIAIACGTDKSSLIHNYTFLYENHFKHLRECHIKLLEIGIDQGSSLEMWHKYFFRSEIFGIDIKDCSHFDEPRLTTYKGSQADPEFLSRINSICGPFDIIIDDGSHFNEHMKISFTTLFPLLKSNGIYVIEDIYCCYWRHTGRPIFIDYLTGLVGALLKYGYTDRPGEIYCFDPSYENKAYTEIEKSIKSIEFYQDIVFITKK